MMNKTNPLSLFSDSENFNIHGFHPLPIVEKEPLNGSGSWTERKRKIADYTYLHKYFENTHSVKRVAILLDSIKLAFAIDVDGAIAINILQKKIVPRLSEGLKYKIHKTTHTKTANGGFHWLFEIRREDFPSGVKQETYWRSMKNDHAEIKVIGSNQYLIERGVGYQPIRGIEALVELTPQEVSELFTELERFDKETKVMRRVSSKLQPYWTQPKRNDIALWTAGYLRKNGVPKNLVCELMEHIIENAGIPDDNLRKSLRRVEATYAKDFQSETVGGYALLLEAVDGDTSVITTIDQEFEKLGYHFNGNGKGNRDGKDYPSSTRQKQKQDKHRIEYVQKYSISETVLAEAIIIGEKSLFAVADFSDCNEVNITLQKQIELDDDRKTVLKPLDLMSYINKPYRFRSEDEFWIFIKKGKVETLDSLYRKTKVIWKKYVDADNFHISICSADTIFTHKQDRVGTTHYLFFVGDNDTGKSAGLTILQYLAYRNMSSIGITSANIYQFLGSRDEGVGTICEDEADNIDLDTEKMRLYKSGYAKGKVVPKTDTSYGRNQYKFYAYCFKAFAAEKLPDPVVAKGFLQRIVELKCTPGFPDYDISEVIDPGDDENLQLLLDELVELRNLIFCYCRLLHYKDKIHDIKLNIRNREKQLFKPVLRVFHGTDTFNEILPVISRFVSQKREAKVSSYHSFLFQLLKDMIIEQKSLELESSSIWSKFMSRLVDWKGIPHKPQSIDTVEFGIKSQKEIIQTFKDVFDAKPSKRHGIRGLIFDQKVLEKMSKVYDVKVEIKVQEGEDDVGAFGALGAFVGLEQYIPNPPESKENGQSKEGNDEISNETTASADKTVVGTTANQSRDSENVPHTPLVPSNPGKLEKVPDPSLVEATTNLNNFREEYDEFQCNNCRYKEAIHKNNTKPKFCPICNTPSTE
jgi:hypothetical protein